MTMLKPSPWIRLMPLFGGSAIVVLAIAAGLSWFFGREGQGFGDLISARTADQLALLLIGLALPSGPAPNCALNRHRK